MNDIDQEEFDIQPRPITDRWQDIFTTAVWALLMVLTIGSWLAMTWGGGQ